VAGGQTEDVSARDAGHGGPDDPVVMVSQLPTMGMPIQVSTSGDVMTIGVAIEVPEPHAAELQFWRATFGDPMADLIPAHVTLLPPTPVATGQLDEIGEHLADVAAATARFGVRLTGTDTFRPVSPVVYVRVVDGVEGCDDLQRRVRTGPLTRELSFPYHPHVTVAHELDGVSLDRAQDTLSEYTATFTVASIGLYEQDSGGKWRYRERFGFAGPAD
jgi:2'-5' RNA ligase